MFGKLFGRKNNRDADNGASASGQSGTGAEQAPPANPLGHLKVGAMELVQRLAAAMRNEQGVHVESLLGALGSLAGYCCTDSITKWASETGQSLKELGVMEIETTDGSRYYAGRLIDEPLVGHELALWPLVAGMAKQLGSEDYPDYGEIVQHVASTFGKAEFGIPRVPDQHRPGDLPINYVRALWPALLPFVEQHVPVFPQRGPMFGFAIQNVMEMGKDVIQPGLAAKLVMECAVPMSRLDPAHI